MYYAQQPWTSSEPSGDDNWENDEFVIGGGDKLFIRRIDLIPAEGLLHGCNLERRNIYLAIKRKNENVIQVDQPIIMRPINEIWENSNFAGNYYRAIRGRIEGHFDIDNAVNIDNIKIDTSFSYRALRKLSNLLRLHGVDGLEAVADSKSIVVLPTCSSDEDHDNSNVWLTVNDAVALGYLWAKSEDERNWAPFGESSVPQQTNAGSVSASVRRKSADDWKRVYWARLAEIWSSATKKPPRTKMIELVLADHEQWEATKKRLNLPNATMRGRSSLEKAMLKKSELAGIEAKKGE